MTPSLAFAVNCYDKLYDVEILIDILRHLYGKDAYIYVTCSDNGATKERFAHLDIDFLEIGEPVDMLPPQHPLATGFNPRLLQLRRVNQLARGLRHCAEHSNRSHTVSLHADAWPLSRKGLETVVGTMVQNNKLFGSYSYGVAYATVGTYPESMLTDIFFVANNAIVRERNVFNYTHRGHMSLHPNVHGYLSAAIKYNCGMQCIHPISNHMDAVGWDGEPKRVAPFTAMGPIHFVPAHGLLHFAESDFLPGWCHALLSNYLVDYGFSDCPYVRRHLENHPRKLSAAVDYFMALKARYGDRIRDDRFLRDSSIVELDRMHAQLTARNAQSSERIAPMREQDILPTMKKYLEDLAFLQVLADQVNNGIPFDEVVEYRITDGVFRGP